MYSGSLKGISGKGTCADPLLAVSMKILVKYGLTAFDESFIVRETRF